MERSLHYTSRVTTDPRPLPAPQASDRSRLVGYGSTAPSTPLRGREDDVAWVRQRVRAAAAQGSGGALLRGRAGMGKTRILASALECAEADGWRTVIVTPHVDSAGTPLAALMEAATRSAPPLIGEEEVEPLLRGPDPQYWVIRALSEALQRLAVETPVLFVVDDLQWLDPASCTVFAGLVRALEGEQIAWLLATRTGALPAAPSRTLEWARRSGVIRDLDAITHEAAVDIATDLLGVRPGPALEAALDRTARVPLHVVELLRGLREEELLTVDGLLAEAVEGKVPARFGASSRERLTYLSPRALQVIQVGSLFGRRFRLVDALAVLELSAASAADAVRELIAAEIVEDDGERLAFLHDTLRDAAEETLSPSLRAALLREVVQTRIAAGEPATAIAGALIGVAEPGDEQSFSLLHHAAMELAALDSHEAGRLASTAVELSRNVPRFAVRAAELIPIMWAGGRGDLAYEATTDLAPYLSAEQKARMLLAVARQQTESSFAQAIATTDAALALPRVSRATRTELLAVRALNAANKADHVELQRTLTAARATADPDEDHLALATIDATAAVFEFNSARWDAAAELIDRALQEAELAGIRANTWMPEGLWLAFQRNSMGQPDVALALVEAGVAEAERARSAPTVAFWSMVRSRVLFDLGRLDEARVQAESVLDLAAELGLGDFANATAGIVLARIAIHTGDALLAGRMRPLVRSMADSAGVTRAGRWMLALTAVDEDRLADAYELSALARASLRDPIPPMTTPADYGDDVVLVEILLTAGDRTALAELEQAVERRAGQNPGHPLPAAIRDAVVGRVRGDGALIDRAAETLRSASRPLVRARVLEMRDVVGGRDDHARASLEEALRIYEEHGATRDASRVLFRLRARGIRRRPSPAAAPGRLSAREAQVLEHLVAGGTTQQIADALFLSPHTVISHVRHIYAKLGVNSREELRRRRGPASAP